MISDALADTITAIRQYQIDMPHRYDQMWREIDHVVATMDALRAYYDGPEECPMPEFPRFKPEE